MVRRSSTAALSKKESSNSLEGNTSQEEISASTNMDIDQDTTTADKITGNSNNSNRPKTLLSHPLLRPPCTTDIGYFQQQANDNNDDDENKNNDDDDNNYADVTVASNESTMYPKSLVTGFYGSRRERVRHTVHEGALRLPRESFDVMSWKNPSSSVNYYNEDSETIILDSIPTDPIAATTTTTTTGNNKKKTKAGSKKSGVTVSNPAAAVAPAGVLYELPKLDSVIRPSLNLQKLGKIKVTYVSGQVVVSGEGGTSSTFNPLIRSVARNQYITVPPETEIQRLRGGGGGDDTDNNIITNTNTNISNHPMTTPDNQQSSFIVGTSTSTGNTAVPLNSAAAAAVVVGSHNNNTNATGALSQGMTSSTMKPGVNTPTSIRTGNNPVVPPSIISNRVAGPGTPNQPLYTPPVTSSNTAIMPASTRAIAAPAPSHSIQPQATNQPPITASNMNVKTTMVGINTAGVPTNIAHVPLQSAAKQTILPSTAAPTTIAASTSNNILPIVQNAQVIPLPSKPPSQWEQHAPTVTDEHQIDSMSKMPKPGWFQQNVPSDFEMTVLPEWFDSSAPHRTPELYIATRNNIISLSQKLGSNRYVTATMARRSIPGDVGSILRLHAFLTTYALINEDAINDTAPTPTLFRPQQQQQQPPSSKATAVSSPNQRSSIVDHEKLWASQSIRDRLVAAVVQQANSNTSTNSRKRNVDGTMSNSGAAASSTGSTVPIIDWAAVAESIGQGVLPTDCERHFVSMSLETMRDGNDDNNDIQGGDDMVDVANVSSDNKDTNAFKVAVQRDFIKDLVSTCDPDVVRDVAVAALQSITSSSTTTAASISKTDLTEVQTNLQKATSLGLLVHNIAQEAYNEEQNVARLLAELVTIRMQKLENRLSLLDDVEGLLEAERVSLELERRDLYTARCRHWFGGT